MYKRQLLYCLPLCLLFASCSDLLDEESYSETGKDNYLNNAKEAETVLQGVYKNLANEYTYSYHLSLLFTISTDIAQCEGSSTTSFREIPTNSHNASTSQISRTWQKLYSAIYDANDFIETVSGRMDNWGSSDRELATIYLGEARALRALFYFELVRWYGTVSYTHLDVYKRQVLQNTPDGPSEQWHRQYDNNTFELWVKGRNFFPDSGCFSYGGTSSSNADRRKYAASTAHNTVTLDNKNVSSDGKMLKQFSKSGSGHSYQALVLENPSYEGLTHRRTIFMVDDKFYVILDEAYGSAAGTVNLNFNITEGTDAQVVYDLSLIHI